MAETVTHDLQDFDEYSLVENGLSWGGCSKGSMLLLAVGLRRLFRLRVDSHFLTLLLGVPAAVISLTSMVS